MARKQPITDEAKDPTPKPDETPAITPAVAETSANSPSADLIAGMSAPNADAIAAVKAAETPEPETQVVQETPVKRGRGRPPGSGKGAKSRIGSIHSKSEPGNVADPQQAKSDKDAAAIRMTANAATQMTIVCGYMVGGQEFAPGPNPLMGGIDDREFLTDAYAEYFRSKKMVDLPPGVALSFALLAYIAPRFRQPITQSRVKIAVIKVGGFFSKIFKRKQSNAAQSNPGHDGERKDDTRETDSK